MILLIILLIYAGINLIGTMLASFYSWKNLDGAITKLLFVFISLIFFLPLFFAFMGLTRARRDVRTID